MSRRSKKVFCIGAGKTGTTSIEKALSDHGFQMGDQAKGELLLHDYAKRNFKPIIRFCKSAEAFQDAPFCFKHTYVALDQYFKNAKFILTIRDSDDQWYNSLVNFHSKLFTRSGSIPTWEDLKNAEYRYPGYAADVRKLVFGINENENPYDETKLKDYYNQHNEAVIDYFKNKTNLLVINLSDGGSFMKFIDFLGIEPLYNDFPWENKTSTIK